MNMNLTPSSRARLRGCTSPHDKSGDSRRSGVSPAVRSRKASAFTALALTTCVAAAHAQISLTSAVDLALKNSPQVKMAEDNLVHARASLEEARDVYIPTVSASSGAGGWATGFPLGVPTSFNLSAQSLVFSFSQRDYLRSADEAIKSSDLALTDARQRVAIDAVDTYLSLDKAQRQHDALAEEASYAARLEAIIQDRFDAGQDTAMELTKARRTGVQIRLQLLQLDDEIASGKDHLARLVGLPGNPIATVPDSIPKLSTTTTPIAPAAAAPDSPSVSSAFASAQSKRELAFGDSRYLLRPQFSFGLEYSRISLYNSSYVTYYPSVAGLATNAFGFSVNVNLPILDMGRRAKARASMADANHAQHEAISARDQEQEDRLKLDHNMAELAARADLASLDEDLAREQLEVVLVQLKQPAVANAPALTPKDEQNARILERQRYIEMLDTNLQLRQAQVKVLQQNGQLDTWLRQAARITP
jgi:outer membrane protein TolC